ncbi:glycosyltransferase family 25 protein [Vibrio vulnificus]|uniref:Beta-1,4-galactosyltransferase n=1 Tax=Vibrio vulnificus TaxID=672 RepID=A0AAN1UD41_VIBVL|nr:glycosyltransferase family 25 protein [Vibrio vulnificus]AMG13721.1 UDP-glucose--lipooligosaccharide glucosyltransferase [Vibrio vulnificus]AXX61119.1 Beta-1,4-galactosyltransferase [Vibrio vulnificus]EGQ9832378.1 glycosyltransferase family 25 protein [Vibrio vulnificus]EGR0105160.1 glycosyltransferase family 25 protein [Vibrio vulnificus]EGR0235314.1 glycosyltransferase family 25 protein [Vibrio vulnificus]
MRTFVISLKNSVERRAHIEKQFSHLDQDFEFFDAIDGRQGEHSLFSKYNVEKRLKIKGYGLTAGELGCFASHYLLWEKCLELNEPIVVIEDDAQLEACFDDSMSRINELEPYGYVRLFVNGRKRPFVKVGSYISHDIVEYLRGPGATRAYFVTPMAARKFIESAQEWLLPVDDYMDQFWLNKVACRGIMPGIVKNETDHGSYIVRNKSHKKNRITRELYSLIMMIQRHWHLFRYGPRS